MKLILQSIIMLLLSTEAISADPLRAVVQIPSHGGSGTVIFTEPGYTEILTCAHCFEGSDGNGVRLRTKPLHIEAPHPTANAPMLDCKIKLVSIDYNHDLALITMSVGPLPHVAPVAPSTNGQPKAYWSCGYDEMIKGGIDANGGKPQIYRATYQSTNEFYIFTIEHPVPGRSGGGLIGTDGLLYGTCMGHELLGRKPNQRAGRGMYTSHAAVLKFLGSPLHLSPEPIENPVFGQKPKIHEQPQYFQLCPPSG